MLLNRQLLKAENGYKSSLRKSYNYILLYLQLNSGDQRPLKKRAVPKGYSGGETERLNELDK
jgi:hypothetical protein